MLAIALYLDADGLVPTALLVCVFHECGHLVALWYVRGELRELRLTATGAEMIIEGELSSFKQLILAMAGPITNIIVAGVTVQFYEKPVFVGMNLVIAMFNLIPLSPLDGGRALYAIFSWWHDDCWVERVQEFMDCMVSWALLILGVVVLVLGGSFTLLIVAIWMLWTRKRTKLRKSTCK